MSALIIFFWNEFNMGTQNIIRMPSKICQANFYSFFPISFVPATSLVGARSTTTAMDNIAVFCQSTPASSLPVPAYYTQTEKTGQIRRRQRRRDRSDADRGNGTDQTQTEETWVDHMQTRKKNRNGFEKAYHQLPLVTACPSVSHADRWDWSTSAFEGTSSSTSCHCLYLPVSNCQLFRIWEQKWFRGDLIYPLPPVPWFSQE